MPGRRCSRRPGPPWPPRRARGTPWPPCAVALGRMLSTGPLDMAAVLGRFSAAHPDVVVQARQAAEGTAAHVRDLREGALDLALVALAGPPPAGIVTRL